MTGSNRRPPACKAGALPAELIPRLPPYARLNQPVSQPAAQSATGCVSLCSDNRNECRHFARSCQQSFDHQTRLRGTFSRKEVIQPHLPIRLPCYDFTPVMKPTVVIALLAVRLTTSGGFHSHGVTGGVYKTRERIHRDMLIRDY